MIELVIIRHGETAWNAERRLQGHVDIPLNESGLTQARQLAEALTNESLDVIISSDLLRAQQTAQAIASRKGLNYVIDPQWRERSFGGFEGQLIANLAELYPQEHAAWRAYQVDSQFPLDTTGTHRGESIRQFHQRVENGLLKMLQQYQAKKVALVVHGGILECAYRIAHELPLNAPRQVVMLNASINRFELNQNGDLPRLKLLQWGDVAHLDMALDEISNWLA